MQKTSTTFLSVGLIVMLCLDACVSHDFPAYVCEDTYSFAQDIRPIIETKCAISGCHNGDMGPNLNWRNFDAFHRPATSGLLKFNVTNRVMPPSNSAAGPLTQEQINVIACWADQGALNN